jgi:ketosteroid isomerase-like protein
MHKHLTRLLLLLLLLTAASCRLPWQNRDEDPAAARAAVVTAHEAYVAAINANKADAWLATLGDDVVYFVPNRPALVGRDAVGNWVAAYLQEVTTHWTKAVPEFTVTGEWAFGRYVYTASDSIVIHDPETEGGGTANDSGWGLVVYHHDADGAWRVARDAWGSERPAR